VIGALGTVNLGLFNAAGDLEVPASVAIHARTDFHARSRHTVSGSKSVPTGDAGVRPASPWGWRPYSYGHWVWTDSTNKGQDKGKA